MEPEERAGGAGHRRAAQTLGPTARVLEASNFTPTEVKVHQGRYTVGQSSVYIVKELSLHCVWNWSGKVCICFTSLQLCA